MRIKFILLAILASFLLLFTLMVSATSISFEEADISSLGSVGHLYELNVGDDGSLYLSHEEATYIHKIHPNTNIQEIYLVYEPVLDAKPDSSGDIWWTSGTNEFGMVDVSTNLKTMWEIGDWVNEGGTQLWGLDFDDSDYVWISEWIGIPSSLYRFDPSAEIGETNLCTYTISGGSNSSYYILVDDERIWQANWELQRIYQINPGSGSATWWQIPDADAVPRGIALDGEGDFWWVDHMKATVSELDPDTNMMTSYDLTAGSQPWMLAINGDEIWYSEFPEPTGTEGISGTLGMLDTTTASGNSMLLNTGTTTVSQVCDRIDPIKTDVSVLVFPIDLTWTSSSADAVVEGSGLTVYQLPPGSQPYGIAVSGGYLWVSDQGDPNNPDPVFRRDASLMRFPVSQFSTVYLPLVVK